MRARKNFDNQIFDCFNGIVTPTLPEPNFEWGAIPLKKLCSPCILYMYKIANYTHFLSAHPTFKNLSETNDF